MEIPGEFLPLGSRPSGELTPLGGNEFDSSQM